MSHKIIFLAQYATGTESYKRLVSPAACTKISSILDSLDKINMHTQVFSIAKTSQYGFIRAEEKNINSTVNCFFISYNNHTNRALRFFYRLQYYFKLLHIILKRTKKNDYIWIYHTYFIEWIFVIFSKIKGLNLIFEIEEIYGDVTGNAKKKWLELQVFKFADGYVFPTQLLDKLINKSNKPSIIIHGTYQIQSIISQQKMFDDRNIHVVYAGTLDPRKGGAVVAAAAAEYLPYNYHVHILGFGSNEQVLNIKHKIEKLKSLKNAKVSYDGCLSGIEYIKFIQSCQIGLSTQNPNASFNNTSFPSKILSYMANGLRVVSVRIPAIEQSSVSDLITYYDNQTPQEIAKAILSVDLNIPYDSRARLKELDKQFQKNLQQLLQKL